MGPRPNFTGIRVAAQQGIMLRTASRITGDRVAAPAGFLFENASRFTGDRVAALASSKSGTASRITGDRVAAPAGFMFRTASRSTGDRVAARKSSNFSASKASCLGGRVAAPAGFMAGTASRCTSDRVAAPAGLSLAPLPPATRGGCKGGGFGEERHAGGMYVRAPQSLPKQNNTKPTCVLARMHTAQLLPLCMSMYMRTGTYAQAHVYYVCACLLHARSYMRTRT